MLRRGFDAYSYPIEVGLALEGGSKFCTLSMPAPDWTHWDDDAEKVHRISRDILETYGRQLEDVANFLNAILYSKTVFADGWVVDKPWLTTLFHAARVPMEFSVSSLEMILSEPQMAAWQETKTQVVADMGLVRHRASFDALIIQETYRRTRNATSGNRT